MNVSELLKHTRKNYLRDAEAPFLWDSTELLRYLNEAETLFARHTHCLTDESSEFTTLTTVADQSRYALDPRIIFVSELYSPDGHQLRNVMRSKLPRSIYTGTPRMYTLDAGVSSVRLAPTPDDVYELQMLVARKPLTALATQYDTPEIPEEYHLALCDWVAYKALRNNDTEASNTTAAENFRVDWETKLRDAKREAYHMRAGAQPRVANNWTLKRSY
jgi:hypothetical protein